MPNAILLISCPDQKGITAAVTSFVFENGGNIIDSSQHIDEQTDTFFMRIEWSLKGFAVAKPKIGVRFKPIAKKFNMRWDLYFTNENVRAAIFVSQHLHCLYDLLLRQKAGQLSCEIAVILSNHPQAKAVAKAFGVKFVQMDITKENKIVQEKRQLALLKKEQVELVVLARYHQILSSDFVSHFPNRIINIHHSFMPAFA